MAEETKPGTTEGKAVAQQQPCSAVDYNLAAVTLCKMRGVNPDEKVSFQARYGSQIASRRWLAIQELREFGMLMEAIEESRRQNNALADSHENLSTGNL